jgi:8-oxo-dGTP pyrophosphatase MutT (NUDIX family)
MKEEIFDVVNELDEVIGQRLRRDVHRLGLRHRAVHVLVFNRKGQLFLQKRSMLKDCSPGLWDSSSSGHLDTGEEYDACAVREVREEIGVVLSNAPVRLFKLPSSEETGQEFCWVYRAESEGPFVLQVEEIESGDWFDTDHITAWVAEKPDDFCSAFKLIWKTFQSSAR